jgi:hypothetical protein
MSENLTPQQSDFQRYYFDPKSETFSNAYKSAKKAGYSEESSLNITGYMPKWLSEMLGKHKKLVLKAEKNLETLLDSEDEKIKSDLTKFTLSRLAKDKYSDRTEHTGEDGKPINIIIDKEIAEKHGIKKEM